MVITTDPTNTSNLANNSEVEVTLSTSTNGAKIYYTLDGSTPTYNSTLYEGPFTVTASGISAKTVTIKAIGMRSAYYNSQVATKVITFAADEQPQASGSVKINSVTDDVYLYTGQEYEFNLEVEYEFAHISQAKIYLGFNNEKVDGFNLIADEVVTSTSGTVTFENISTKVQYWEDEEFGAYVKIVDFTDDEDGKVLDEDFLKLDVSRPVTISPTEVEIIGFIEDGRIWFDDWVKVETELTYQNDDVSFEGLYLLYEGEEIERDGGHYDLEENNDGTGTLTITNNFFNDLFGQMQVIPSQLSFELIFSVRETDTTISIPFTVDVNGFDVTTAHMNPQQDLPYEYNIEIFYENLDLNSYNLSIVRYEDNEFGFSLHSSTDNETLDVRQLYPENNPNTWWISTTEEFTGGVYYIVLHTGEFDQGEIIAAKNLNFIGRLDLKSAM